MKFKIYLGVGVFSVILFSAVYFNQSSEELDDYEDKTASKRLGSSRSSKLGNDRQNFNKQVVISNKAITKEFKADQFIREHTSLERFSTLQEFPLIQGGSISVLAIEKLKLRDFELQRVADSISLLNESFLNSLTVSPIAEIDVPKGSGNGQTYIVNNSRSESIQLLIDFNDRLINILGEERALYAISNMHLVDGPLSYGVHDLKITVSTSQSNKKQIELTQFDDDGEWVGRQKSTVQYFNNSSGVNIEEVLSRALAKLPK
jgi:hypothetical protein